MLNRQLLRIRGETQQPLPPAPMPAMWQCMSTMPAGMGWIGRKGRAPKPAQPKTAARIPTSKIFRRHAPDEIFDSACFIP
jgi:hypothetical protein